VFWHDRGQGFRKYKTCAQAGIASALSNPLWRGEEAAATRTRKREQAKLAKTT
jgi:hypothetical protein